MVKKITVYTISTCPFSKQEKDYLAASKFSFEEKNVEEKKEYLSEMLATSDNFAGVPFTVIEKDDGTKVSIKGFAKEEFDKALGLIEVVEPPLPPPVDPSLISSPDQTNNTSTKINADQSSTPTTTPAPTETPVTANPSQPAQPPVNDPLNSVLADLQQKAQGVEPNPASPPPPPTGAPASDLPQIPDFPAK